MSETHAARSPDGTRIAYDVTGEGTPLSLLHAGFVADRKRWHELGYVARLATDYQVITLDLRGHGESDQPTDPAQFVIEKVIADVLAVADACQASQFLLWGFSYGGNVARYLAAMTDRVIKVVIGGIPLARALPAEFVQDAIAKWQPIADARVAGTFDPSTLSPQEREFAIRANLRTVLALIRAMDAWPGAALCRHRESRHHRVGAAARTRNLEVALNGREAAWIESPTRVYGD